MLCAGIDAWGLVAETLGVTPVWCSEIDPDACRVLTERRPDVPNLGDLTKITDPPATDVVVAGFPCQPISGAGRQEGLDDDRWLWPDIAALVRRMDPRPAYVWIENVPRLLTVNGGRALAEVLHDLDVLGFDAEWGCLRASAVGACHRRDRWWCVAAHPDRVTVGPEPFDDAGSGGTARVGADGPPTCLATPTAWLGRRPAHSVGDAERWNNPNRSNELSDQIADLLPTSTAMDGHGARNLTARRSTVGPATNNTGTTLSDVAYANLWNRYGPAIAAHEQALGRPAPSPVVDAPTTGARAALSPRFVEWMQMLPEGWVTDLFDWMTPSGRRSCLRLLGNAGVPGCAAVAWGELMGRFRLEGVNL
jgi:DNA (cytosine-5)-methyltransferase 1